jgi:3-deoxy-7-phosphoheptulonate synthase
MKLWRLDGWRAHEAAQQPVYSDTELLRATTERIRMLPALVAPREITRVKQLLAEAAAGERFVLHGGDCAERFDDCRSLSIMARLRILFQMSLVISYGARKPVIVLGRLGGQYAKPRSADTESVGGVTIPTFRGDNVNDIAPTPEARRPDPTRLERGYFHAAATINLVRALGDAGFGSLSSSAQWELDWMPRGERRDEYTDIATRVRDALDYLERLGALRQIRDTFECFVSHEALLLPYEEAMTRVVPEARVPYNMGAHFLWIGDRTRQLDGAHVELLRGVKNPLGIKVGPTCAPDELVRLVELLDPDAERGKVTVITRLGRDQVARRLPPLIRALRRIDRPVLWSCDPMHGNTIKAPSGHKTRSFETILAELRDSFEIHRSEGSRLDGVHFEVTAKNVTECTGGAAGVTHEDLGLQYDTACDPRLNYKQSLEMAFLIGRMLGQERTPR